MRHQFSGSARRSRDGATACTSLCWNRRRRNFRQVPNEHFQLLRGVKVPAFLPSTHFLHIYDFETGPEGPELGGKEEEIRSKAAKTNKTTTRPLPHSEIFVTEISEFSARHPTITGWTEILQRSSQHCSGAGAPRHDQRRVFYVDTVVDCRYLEMDVVREREGSLNRSEVEGGAMRNGMCRKILRSGAALEAIVRRGSARSVRRCTVWNSNSN